MIQENRPLVTAVVPVYNHEKYVIESIQSILNQTYRDVELIVINDGSKDRSHERILTLLGDCKQRFVRLEYINRENKGLSATLNEALKISKGKYFSVLASDDVALPEKIEILVNALEKGGATFAAAFGNALFIDDEGKRIRLDKAGHLSEGPGFEKFIDFYLQNRHLDLKGEQFGTYETLIAGNYLPAMSNIVRTATLLEVGGWTPGNIVEDWEMWLKLSKSFGFIYVDQPVALYRQHGLNITNMSAVGVLNASMMLVENEKEFCEKNNLASVWRDTSGALMINHLLNRELSKRTRLKIFRRSDKRSLLSFVAKRLAKRFWSDRASPKRQGP